MSTASEICGYQGYVAGPKSAIGPGWLTRQIIRFNNDAYEAGYTEGIEIKSVSEGTTFFRRQISFTLHGPENLVDEFALLLAHLKKRMS